MEGRTEQIGDRNHIKLKELPSLEKHGNVCADFGNYEPPKIECLGKVAIVTTKSAI